jgi:hypothetical protein
MLAGKPQPTLKQIVLATRETSASKTVGVNSNGNRP